MAGTRGAMVSIILPAYGERDNLRMLIPGLVRAFIGREFEIIVVDDYSGDGTPELVSALASRNRRVRLVSRNRKSGLASAITDGARAASGELLLVMDADRSHPASKALELCDALADADIAIGSRNLPQGGVGKWPAKRKAISGGATLLARLATGTAVSDPMSGFFAIRREAFFRTRFRVKGYKILLNVLSDNPGVRVAEVPYVFQDRRLGSSKLGAREAATYVLDLVRLVLG